MSREITGRDVLDAGWLLDPAGFGNHLSGGVYRIYPWIDYVSRIVALATAKGGARLLISVPPQHGKSWMIAGLYPAWRLELDARRRIGVVSYNETLAARSVRFGRDLLRQRTDVLRVRLGSKQAEEYYETVVPAGTQPGYVRAMGILGGVTGFGFDDLVIDDPYKNYEEASSEAYRAKVSDVFWSVLMTRLQPGANVLAIMTRWDDFDIFGELIRGGGWTEIRLPALAEENDPLGRKPGEPLCPERKSLADILVLRDGPKGDGRGAMPPRIFQALYQGKPLAAGGGMFKPEWFDLNLLAAPPVLVSARVRYWDPAASKRQNAHDPDYAVGTLMSKIRGGGLDGAFCVEDVDRGRGTALETENRIVATAVRDGKSVPIRIEEEPGSQGKLYVSYLQRRLAGWNVKGVPHGTDKATRAKPFAAQCEVGNVKWVNGPWLPQAKGEFLRFVGDGSEDHDDVPDSVTGAFGELAGKARWPWESIGAQMGGRHEPERGVADEIGFDHGEFARALDALAPADALRDLYRGGGR